MSKIRDAVDNCKNKENAAKTFDGLGKAMQYVLPGMMVGGVVTSAILNFPGTEAVADHVTSSISTTVNAFQQHPNVLKSVGATIALMGAAMVGVGYLENKDGKKTGMVDQLKKNGVKQETVNYILGAWKYVESTNEKLTGKVAERDKLISDTLTKPDNYANNVLRLSGLDPLNANQMIKLHGAYVHGLKHACIEALKKDQKIDATNGLDSQAIIEGMTEYFVKTGADMSLAEKFKEKAVALITNSVTDPKEIAMAGLYAIQKIEQNHDRKRDLQNSEEMAFG